VSEEYREGQGCTCFAWSWVECGCEDADWTPKEVYTLRKRIAELEEVADNQIWPSMGNGFSAAYVSGYEQATADISKKLKGGAE
tara:strand:- start:90 stop:341 length:252 start_codon:yes stop_codon:yes gene_type:complete